MRRTIRLGGALLVAVALVFLSWTGLQVLHVSPVHWGLLAPYLAVVGVPGSVAVAAGTAMVLSGRGTRLLFLALALTTLQAGAVRVLAPDIFDRYTHTVQSASPEIDSREGPDRE